MPKAWTEKDERQFDAIKDQLKQNGKSGDDAAEIAARTVNKQRRKEGRTSNRTTSGTGNPNTPLEERTVDELRNIARKLKIPGRSKMTTKSQLTEAIRHHRSN